MASESSRSRLPIVLLVHWLGRYAVLWSCLALVIFLVQAVLAALLHDRDQVVGLLRLLESMPFFKSALGGEDLIPTNPAAIVAIGYRHPLVLTMLLVNAVVVPTGLITRQCEDGTMELLLARRLRRSQVYALAGLLALGSEAVLSAVILLGTAVWTRVFDFGEIIALDGFVNVAVNVAALGCAFVGLSLLAAVTLRERSRAVGLVVGYAAFAYILELSVESLRGLEDWRFLTLFEYSNPNAVLKAASLPWGALAVLGGVLLASSAAGWTVWRRKDLHTA